MDKEQLIIFLLIFLFVIVVSLFIIYYFSEKKFKNFNKELDEKFDNILQKNIAIFSELQRNINQNMDDDFKNNQNSIKEIQIGLTKIEKTQIDLKNITDELNKLQTLFINKKFRGQHGEIELYSILDQNDGMFERQYKLKNGYIVDGVIKNLDGSIIPVDSKFPFENFIKIEDQKLTQDERNKAKTSFKNDILKHINDIYNKYVDNVETSDIAFMFIPSETIYAEIFNNYEDLVLKAYDKKVFFASPSTLVSFLTTIKYILMNQKRTDKIQVIQREINLLSAEFEKFKVRQEKVFNDFSKVFNDFKNVEITSNKIIKQFEKIEKAEIDDYEN